MSLLIAILVIFLVIILCVYLVQKYLPTDDGIKQIAILIIVLIGVLAMLNRAGIF